MTTANLNEGPIGTAKQNAAESIVIAGHRRHLDHTIDAPEYSRLVYAELDKLIAAARRYDATPNHHDRAESFYNRVLYMNTHSLLSEAGKERIRRELAAEFAEVATLAVNPEFQRDRSTTIPATTESIARSAWAENILDSIMPIIMANAPQGIGDRDYETMVKSIMARLPDEQKPAPITLTAAEAAHKIMGMFNPIPTTAGPIFIHEDRKADVKARIAQMIATIQAEARAEGILGRLAAMTESTADPIAAQAAADRLMQWADHPGAKELAERTQAAQALEQTGPAPLATPEERAEHIYSATIWQYIRRNQNEDHAKHQIVSHIAHEIEQAMAQPEPTGPAGGKLHIHMTVDDMTPTIQRIIDSAMAELAKRIESGV